MEIITLQELLEAVDGVLLGEFANLDTVISRVDIDSRTIHDNAVFLPLIGERFDGHAYITQALNGGALGCITAREQDYYQKNKFYIKVSNTQKALRDLALWYKNRFDIPFIGVTGSVGKTTTKDMIAAVLSAKYKVLKTEGNFNNNVGLPLTLLRLTRSHEICVLEMGMDKLGEIDYLGDIVNPQVGVITNIGDAHIEQLGSHENILKAKCELLPHIQQDGLLVVCGDDALLNTLEACEQYQILRFGTTDTSDYWAVASQGDGTSYIKSEITTPKMKREIEIPAVGKYMVYPTLTAVAVGEYFGLSTEEIVEGVLRFVPTRMRMNISHRANGITILDDTYNANPQAMRAAIQVLADSGANRKIAILGDMFELGPFAPALHIGVGECLGNAGIDCVIAVGELAEKIADGARQSGLLEVYHYKTKAEAKSVLKEFITHDTTILIKASRGMALEELTIYLVEQTTARL